MESDPSGTGPEDGNTALQFAPSVPVLLYVVKGGFAVGDLAADGLVAGAAVGGWEIGAHINGHFGISQSIADWVSGWNGAENTAQRVSVRQLVRWWWNDSDAGRSQIELHYPFLRSYGGLVRRYDRKEIEVHHLFQQEFREWFRARGINIDMQKYCVPLYRLSHKLLHGMYGAKGFSSNWNDDWRGFIMANPGATEQQSFGFMGFLRHKYGI